MRIFSIILMLCMMTSQCFADDMLWGGYIPSSIGIDYTQDANCVAAYYMNSNGGNETDRSGNGETLTETSGTIPTSSDVPSGYSGNSRDFEAADTEYLFAADGGSTDISGANQPISICFWVKHESSGTQNYVSKYNTTGNQRQYRMNEFSDSTRCVLSSDGSSTESCVGATDISDGSWHHVAGVYNDTDIRVYIDGSLDSNGADNPVTYSSGIFNGTGQFIIGNREGASEYLDGLLDEVIIFDRAISAQEVLNIKNDGIDGTRGGND